MTQIPNYFYSSLTSGMWDYRLLIGEQSEAVRQITTSDSNMQRIAEVIKLLKANFTKSLRVEDLAEQANMSAAPFHRHFKKVTSMSPLQYQKQCAWKSSSVL